MMTSVTETGTAHELRALLDQSPAMLASWDAELRNVVANKAYVDWFDQDPATMTGRHVREVIGEELYAHNLPHIRRALAGEEVVFEVSFTDAHGRDRASEVTYRPRRAPDGPDGSPGEVLGLFTQVVDVTGLVRAREQMDEAQRLADLGSWEARPAEDGAEMTWSAQMYALTGHDPATYRPLLHTFAEHVHPEDRERAVARGTEAATSGRHYEQRYRLVRTDGTVRHVLSRVRAELEDDGGVARLLGTLQDVTVSHELVREVQRANAELRAVNQLNADVLGVVGHDLRQPLALLLGHLEELALDWEDSDEEGRRARARTAYSAARRLNTLVDDILAMASLDSGVVQTRPTEVVVPVLAREALSVVDGGERVRLVDEGVDPVKVDPFHLRQVLVNLATNALRYGRDPVEVRLSEVPTPTGRALRLDVVDHGDGVPAEQRAHLFERFSTPGAATGSRRPGNGFGLYVVRRLVEANGGDVSHLREDGCTVFRVEVPRA